jgi:very-short-patch-repair endonuclease
LGAVVRRLFTISELRQRGMGRSSMRTAVAQGRLTKVARTVYAAGPEPPTALDRARAAVLATGGTASGTFAAFLLGLDGAAFGGLHVTLPPSASNHRVGVHRRELLRERIVVVDGVSCTDALQTLLDIAATLDDARWEQALECALRRGLITLGALEAAAPHCRGARRIRRVLAGRPPGAPPTESLLETLMVQLVRTIPELRAPDRQVRITNAHGEQVARVDLAWPELGLFIELDGQHHKGQRVYDASRETSVVAATGWLCGRFTWHDVAEIPRVTLRRVIGLVAQAEQRPPSATPPFSERGFA